MEDSGVAVGADAGRREVIDVNKPLEVGLESCMIGGDGIEEKGFGDGDGESALQIVLEEGKMKRKRGRPRKGEEMGNKKKLIKPKPGRKKRGRPRVYKKEEVNLEVENNGVKDVNTELRDGELAGEGAADDLNKECSRVEGNGDVEREEKTLGKEIDGRNDEVDRGTSESSEKNLGPRKCRIAALQKMEQSRVEDEILEDEMRIRKRRRPREGCGKEVVHEASGGESEVITKDGGSEIKKRRGRKPSKGLKKQEEEDEKELGARENADESKVNKVRRGNLNKKRRGRKPLKGSETHETKEDGKEFGVKDCGDESEVNKLEGDDANKKQRRMPEIDLEIQEENNGVAGVFSEGKEKEQEGVDKKIVKKRSKGKEVKADDEGEIQDGHNRSHRTLRDRTVKKEEAPRRKKLVDENVRFGHNQT